MKFDDWKNSRLVYSTDASRSQKPQAAAAPAGPAPPPGAQRVLVKIERKGRGGKSVTVVEGVMADRAKLDDLARQLKTACGSGGTLKEGRIEIQGEHRDRVMALLSQQGYRPKASGG
jgi:translation initiation factor 1